MHDYGKSRYGQQLRRFVDGKFYRVPLLNRCMPFMKIIIYFLFGGSEMFVGELKLAVLEWSVKCGEIELEDDFSPIL